MSKSEDQPKSVRQWLAGIGLEQYADVFERNAIDLDVLPALTDADFDQFGIGVLGHRLKLTRTIAGLKSLQRASEPADGFPPISGAGPERRQLTVMFCDLVGSTALSQELDLEDLRALIQRYHQRCGATVERRGGHVAQYLGDGLMVYFGWPLAHEDDAERALQSALDIVDAVKGIPAPTPLQVRIGIATGTVVVGETVGGDASLPQMAIGEAPNVAARVQALAQPDQIIVAGTTRRLVADAFEFENLGEQLLKGISQPVRVWRVLGEGPADGRFAAAHGAGLTPMINRDAEMALLLDRWARALGGAGQAVLLVGEPGIGKSRLAAELCAQVGDGSVLIRMQCSELHCNSAFYPVVASLNRAARFKREDTPEQKREKLETLLTRMGAPLDRVAPYLAALLSLPLDGYPPLQASAQKQKRDIIDALVTLLVEAARKTAALLVIEDLQWIDPTTLEVVDATVEAIGRAPALLVMTTRSSDLSARWLEHPYVSVRALAGLSRNHSLRLALAVHHGLPERILERIVERTEGVPLFLEEVTRALVDSDALRFEGARRLLRDNIEAIEIPSTLKDSLTARLDQLGPSKRVAEYGAVLGRQFRHDAVMALSALPEDAFVKQMEQLVAAGLVTKSGEAPGVVYTFHHALIQDTAYETLLRSDCRSLHARAGDLLAELFPEMTETEPEVLARHHTAGENYAKAVPLWLKAGQRAWLRSAAQEAIAHLSAGLALIDRINDSATRDSLELQLQAALGVVYFAAVSYAAPQARDAFQRASELCERVPEVALKVPVLYGLGAFHTMKGDIRSGHEAFVKLLAEADAAAQPRLQLYSHAVLTWSHFNCGNFERSLVAAQEAEALYVAGALAGPRLSAADPKIISECFRAGSLWSLGYPDQARAASEGVLAHARALGDPYSLAYALNYGALLVPEFCGEYELVLARSEEGIGLAHDLGYPFLEAFGRLWRAWVLGQTGEPGPALAMMGKALERCLSLGVRYHYPQLLSRCARLQVRAGNVGAAQLEIAHALAQIEDSGEWSIHADVYIAEGEVQRAAGGEQCALAEAAYRLALEAAREHRARSWELRAATGLARLWAGDGKGPAARSLLEPVLGSFTEGHTTADLRRAAELLDTLR